MTRRVVHSPKLNRRSVVAGFVRVFVPAIVFFTPLSAAESTGEKVDFNRDIRPVLANKCFKCHGPDAKERKGGSDGLRLDTQDGSRQDLGGYAAIVSGKPDDSELV